MKDMSLQKVKNVMLFSPIIAYVAGWGKTTL